MLGGDDADAAALRLRYAAALELVELASDADARAALLAAVIWPGPELEQHSRAAAEGMCASAERVA
jgi:hypothetical protein